MMLCGVLQSCDPCCVICCCCAAAAGCWGNKPGLLFRLYQVMPGRTRTPAGAITGGCVEQAGAIQCLVWIAPANCLLLEGVGLKHGSSHTFFFCSKTSAGRVACRLSAAGTTPSATKGRGPISMCHDPMLSANLPETCRCCSQLVASLPRSPWSCPPSPPLSFSAAAAATKPSNQQPSGHCR